MQLTFGSLELERFKRIEKPLLLEFSKMIPGVHFIAGRNQQASGLGSNGAGKSSLWDGLTWTLFGQTADGRRNPDIIPWSGKGTTIGRVGLLRNSKQHFIQRTAGPNSLTIDEQPAGQETVVELLGIDYEAFCHTILLGQARPLFFDLKDRERMSLLSTVMGLDRWEERATKALKLAGDLQRGLDQMQGELTASEARTEEFIGLVKTAKADMDAWFAVQQGSLEETEKKIKALEPRLAKAKVRRGEIDLVLDQASVSLTETQRSLRIVQINLASTNQAIAFLERDVSELKSKLVLIDKELRAQSGTCQTCGQILRGAAATKHKANLSAQQRTLTETLTSDRELLNEHKATHAKLAKTQKQLIANEEQLLKDRNEVQADMANHHPLTAGLERELFELHRRRDEQRVTENPHQAQYEVLRRRARDLAQECKELKTKIAARERLITRTKFWVKGFRDIRLSIIDELLQELQLATNAILTEVGLGQWEIRYDMERELKSGNTQRGLNVVILSPDNNKPVRWECWSGGEGQRLRLIGAMALGEVLLAHAGITTNLEIMDEPTQHLSAEGVRDVCDLLVDRAQALDRIICYSDHVSVESARFSSVLTMIKDVGGSRLDQ